ncbi:MULTISPECIES: GDCCVxC domain-containing (seleno)protein [unclassified Oleiphilus]|uniref:GDCCVxC domain-containing (seleno)protein n=1 Tax=unclassified Oleiphilus TaxID=2631174 RepID=UPI0009ED3048|nr:MULTISPECIES: GDCCVxC domain-containing (seleno)protein [unclassified Oleiphilus]
MANVILESKITCPNCGHHKTEVMPTDACVYFYECEGCKKLLKPNQGDCCVFCSYGSVKCPPIQQGFSCCS